MATTIRQQPDAEYQRGTPVRASSNPRTLPNIAPRSRSARFVLAHHPERWTHGPDGWYPTFARAQSRPGANGVTSTPDGRIDSVAYEAGLQRDGFTVIQPGDPRIPEDLRWYCTRMEMADGGACYLAPWELVGVRNGRTRRKLDDECYRRFWTALLDAGLIRPMSAEVLEDQLSVIDARIGGLQVDRTGGPNVQAQIARADAKREAMVADWERQFGEGASPADEAPAKKGGRRE